MKPLALVLLALLPGAALAQGGNNQAEIEHGLYLARVGDCAACHTVEEDKPYAGDFELPTPFGSIYTSNITPDRDTGLGEWSREDFYRAMTEGLRPDGEYLYPAFPYTHFNILTRADSDAIFAYLQTLQPIRQVVREPDFPWPLSDRTTLVAWNFLNFDDDGAYRPDPDRSPDWNRGQYLVEGLAHCSGCHSPRDLSGAEKKGEERYTGGMAEGWSAPPLHARYGDETGIGRWSETDWADFLKHGRNDHTAAFGPMAEVIEKSTRYLNEADLRGMVAYLTDLPNVPEKLEREKPLATDDPRMTAGRTIYATQCAACHGAEGEGVPGLFATLAGSGIVNAQDPTTLVRLIVEGTRAAVTDRHPTPHAMPSFDWKLSDADVADVTTYLRNAMGNAVPAVSADDVAEIRED